MARKLARISSRNGPTCGGSACANRAANFSIDCMNDSVYIAIKGFSMHVFVRRGKNVDKLLRLPRTGL
jgi:hypothetical protein